MTGTTERPGLDLPTLVAAGVLVVSTALIAHESAHALTGWALGGSPTLVSSTDTRGDWSGLGQLEILIVGASGSVVNGLVALGGWLVLRRAAGRPTVATLLGCLTFTINGWIPTTYLVVSPLLGFGDWTTVIEAFPNRGPLRASAVATSLFVVGVLWRATVESLSRLVGNGAAVDRHRRAVRIVRTVWASGGLVSILAALFSPLALTWSVPIAAGSTLGTTWPLLPAADRVAEHPVPGAPLTVPRSWPVIAAGALAGLVLVAVFGPGVRFFP